MIPFWFKTHSAHFYFYSNKYVGDGFIVYTLFCYHLCEDVEKTHTHVPIDALTTSGKVSKKLATVMFIREAVNAHGHSLGTYVLLTPAAPPLLHSGFLPTPLPQAGSWDHDEVDGQIVQILLPSAKRDNLGALYRGSQALPSRLNPSCPYQQQGRIKTHGSCRTGTPCLCGVFPY